MILCPACFAMGTVPSSTIESVVPSIEYIKSFGTAGSAGGQFLYPRDVCVASYGDLSTGIGNIFVTDTGNNRVQVFDNDGDFMFQFGGFGSSAGKFNEPAGIAVDFNIRMYVVDKENSRVQKFDVRGNYISEFGSFGPDAGQFTDPVGICLDPWGRSFIADSGNNRIQKYDESGSYLY